MADKQIEVTGQKTIELISEMKPSIDRQHRRTLPPRSANTFIESVYILLIIVVLTAFLVSVFYLFSFIV